MTNEQIKEQIELLKQLTALQQKAIDNAITLRQYQIQSYYYNYDQFQIIQGPQLQAR